jgi:hypothetical protein
MKVAVRVTGALILASICMPACMLFGTLWQKASNVPGASSAAESAAKQGGKHLIGGTASPSPTPSPSPSPSPSPAASQSPAAADY